MLATIVGRMRKALPALCAGLVLLAGAGLPAAADAELSPSGGGLVELANKAGQEEATATTTTATNEKQTTGSSSSIPSSILIPALLAGVLLLGGIAFVIVRDARSVAPVAEGGTASGGSRNAEARLRKRRAKAKAAKQQRKRNR
jgi:hypothetical protein